MRTVINNKPVALVVMDAFGKYTHFADASRLRTWIETGKVMPVPAAALSYKNKSRPNGGGGQTAQNERGTDGDTLPSVILFHFLPVFPLTGFTNPRIHTVGRIVLAIKLLQRFRCFIQMTDVMLGRVLRAALL